MTKKKKKKKIKKSRVFLAFVILLIIGYIAYWFIKIPVRGYYISGNTYYTDQEILEKAKLDKYPSYLLTNSYIVSQRFKRDNLIESIKIKRTINMMFNVIVNENKILFYDSIRQKSILQNGKESSYYYEYSPVLINEVTDKKVYKKFKEKIQKIDDNIIKNVSEIKYDPNDIDKERFLFSMNDGNYVYLTLSKFPNINNYLEIVGTLKESKGILYLDYGNYFVPKQ